MAWAVVLLYAAVLAISALASAIKLFDPDLWWLLAGGKLTLGHGIPVANTFSHTWPDYPWRHTQWLFGVILRLCEVAGGLPAVEVLQIVLVSVAFLLAFDTARRQSGGRLSPGTALPLLGIALFASRFRFVPRPHLITFVGLSLLLNLRERRVRHMPLWFFLIGAAWANCHAGVVFGLAAAMAMSAASLLERDWQAVKVGLAATGAFLAGSLLNPNLAYPYLYSFAHLSINDVIPLGESTKPSISLDATFFVYTVLSLAAIPARVRRRDWLYLVLCASFLPLPFFAVRLIPKFVLVTLPGVLVTAQEAWGWGWERSRAVAATGVGLLLLLAVFSGERDYRHNALIDRFGLGANWALVPEGACRFVEKKGLSGRMYNDFSQGGYLAWRFHPTRKVFVDGRIQAYPEAFFKETLGASRDTRNWLRLMQEYGIEYAIVERPFFSGMPERGLLFEAMGWPLVYLDGISAVYVKPASDADLRTADSRFMLIGERSPLGVLVDAARSEPEAMRRELARIDPERLFLLHDMIRFSAAASECGENRMSETIFRMGEQYYPNDSAIRVNYGIFLASQGRLAEARARYAEAARLDGDSEPGRIARQLLEDLGR